MVSSLTSTFDQKLRTLNNSSPLDDGSIPYADECADEHDERDERDEGKSGGSSPSGGSGRGVRSDELKAAWLRSASSSSDEPDARPWPRARAASPPPADDSEKENRGAPEKTSRDDEKDVDTRSQASSGDALPDNDKGIERFPNYGAQRAGDGAERAKLERSGSLTRDRVLRSESLNCRADRPQRSESLTKGDRPSKLEKGEWNVVRRREAGAWRSTKLKRKNGMPERGIKRRHTVGGTKDFDKDGWAARHTRTSSPDLLTDLLTDLSANWRAPLVPPPRAPLESHV